MSDDKNIDTDKYSHVIIDKSKRAFIITFSFIMILVFTSLVFENIIRDRHWAAVAIPVCLLGTVFLFLPKAESWVYEPWQSKHQQYERHYKD